MKKFFFAVSKSGKKITAIFAAICFIIANVVFIPAVAANAAVLNTKAAANTIKSVANPPDFYVDNQTSPTALQKALPKKVSVVMSNGSKSNADVTWNIKGYVSYTKTTKTYDFTGTVKGTKLTAKIKAILSNVYVTSIKAPAAISVVNGTSVDKLSLPRTVTLVKSNRTTAEAKVVWDTSKYNGNAVVATNFVLTGNVEGTEKATNITVKVGAPYIVSATAPSAVSVDNGTTIDKLIKKLPETVTVKMSNGATRATKVVWVTNTYFQNVTEGTTYSFIGYLEDSNKVTTTIEVKVSAPFIVSISAPAPLTVINGSNLAYVENMLPKTVEVLMSNGFMSNGKVTWDTATYDPSIKQAKSYVFTGTVEGTTKTTTVTVNSSAYVEVPYVVSVVNPAVITVDNGTSVNALELPTSVVLNWSSGGVSSASVTWNTSVYDGNTTEAKAYSITGTIAGTEKTATIIVNVGAPIIVSATEPSAVAVNNGTSLGVLREKLPASVNVKMSNGTDNTAQVQWDTTGYNGDTTVAASYDFVGRVAGTNITVTITVSVGAPFIESVVSPAAISVENGTTIGRLTLPGKVEVNLSNHTKAQANVEWDTAEYNGNVSSAQSFNFEGAVEGTEVKATLTINVGAPFIRYVTNPEAITVENGTIVEELGLPENVEATWSNGVKTSVAVEWDTTEYDGNVEEEATYTLKGQVSGTTTITAELDVTVAAPIPHEEPWSLVWSDEFDGTGTNLDTNGIDLSKWGYQEGTGTQYGLDGWGNNEQQYYTSDNIKVEEGKLVIEAKSDGRNGKPYTSGRLWTSPTMNKKYGKFEARMKLPTGEGIWPAFWMMPKDQAYGGWAASGELDIMEARGRLPGQVDGTIHYGKGWPNNKAVGEHYTFPEGQDMTSFHTYSVEWEPGEIRWYVDGNLYQTQNNWFSQGVGEPDKYAYPAPFDQEFYMILNLAVGGNYDGGRLPVNTDFPAIMEVDYVRVYDLTGRPYREPVEPVLEKEELPANAKSAIEDNYVYDVDYDNGFTDITSDTQSLDTTFWNFVHQSQFAAVGTISVDTVNTSKFAKVDITNGGNAAHSVQLIQNVTLAKGRYYKLSFDAKASAPRTMAVKFGGGADRGWSAYSDNFNVSLKSQLQSYEFKFQMMVDTDPIARLEFNMGQNTSSVWIGNVKVEEIESLIDENAAKEPLENGNHVYNGTFDLGRQDRLTYWGFETQDSDAAASVSEATRELEVSISNGGGDIDAVKLIQKGMNLLPTDKYKVTFNGRASANRTIEVELVSKDGTVNYSSNKTINLTETMEEKSFEFIMPDVMDLEGQLVFKLGGSNTAVFIDDVKMVRLTNNNIIELPIADQFPLKNGDFSNGMTKWSQHVQGNYDGWDKVTGAKVENGELKYVVSNIGNNPWDVMLMQTDFQLYKGKTYVVSLDIRASKPRTVEVVVDANGNRYLSKTESITETTKTLSYVLPVEADMIASFKLLLGKVVGSENVGAHDVFVDNVRLEITDAREKAFLLENGDFSKGTTPWSEHVQGRYWSEPDTVTKYSVENGGMKFAIANIGTDPWDIQLFQSNKGVYKGKTYVVHFVARSTTERPIEVIAENSGFTRFLNQRVQLTKETKSFSYEFTMDSDQTVALKFLLGNVQGTPALAHNVFIDNVRFEIKGAKEATGEKIQIANNIQLPAAPVLSPDADNNALGQDITLTFADNAAWRDAITAVTIDGNAIDTSVYTKTAGSITIKYGQFAAAKAYTIVIKGDGFESTEVLQTIEAASMWSLRWSDEFDGTGTNVDTNGVNLDKWAYQNGTGAEYGVDGWGNNEKQYYQKENIEVQDGKLVIEAKQQAVSGKTYTSGKLWTSPTFNKKYGKFEARMKLPAGEGLWPAFWMMPKDQVYGGWAASGELDIMEARGRLPGVVDGTIHYGKGWPNNKAAGDHYTFPEGQDFTSFHTYSVEWEPGEIRWYVDGNLYQTQNNWFSQGVGEPDKYAYPAPFDQEFYMILNLAVGGNYDGGREPSAADFPAIMEVDYVRVYELTGRDYMEPVEPVLVKDELPGNAKQPVNGNYAHDINFEQPITEVTSGALNADYWNFVHVPDAGGAGSVAVETINNVKFAKFNITNGGTQGHAIQLVQNVSLAKGRFYKVSFDAKAAANRSMTVKFGGGADRGWAAYSDNFDVSLKDTVQSYEYRFQMQANTDIATRLEFNMGLNANAVWIGNIKVEEVDSLIDASAAKTPLDNGNHVYNGGFDLGTADRMAFWNFTTNAGIATAAVDADTKELVVAVENGGTLSDTVQLIQKGINLLQSDSYNLTFKARATGTRTIEVKLLSKDGATVYHVQNVNLTTASAEQTVIFTMPAGVTDVEGQLIFNLGAENEDVYMDNVKLIRTTNKNVDYTGIDLFPLKNGNFALGLAAWEPFTQGGNAAFTVVNGEAKVAITNLGGEAWNVMLNQGNMAFSKGMEYVLSFDARASVNRDIEVALENAAYTRRFQTGSIALTPVSKHFEYTFKMTVDDTLAIKYILGKTAQGAVGDVYISNVVLEVKDAPVKRPPMLGADSTNNNAGQSIDIAFGHDADWLSAITAVKVNLVSLTSEQYTIADGNLNIAGAVFAGEGSYNITIEADGYAVTAVTQKMFPSDGNLVLNGNMSNGDTDWTFWNGTPDWSSYAIENGVADVKINYHGERANEWKVPYSWSTQFTQKGIQLKANKSYELSFKAWSTVNRPIYLELTNYNGSPKLLFNITGDQNAVYKYSIKPAQDITLNLTYLLGYIEEGDIKTPSGEHHVYFDDVAIKEVKASPAITADTTENKVGQPITIAFSDDVAWRGAITAVKVDGAVVAEDKYTVAAGSINFDASIFPAIKGYTISVEAEGYGVAQVTQVVKTSAANVALNKTASASNEKQAARLAFDGNTATRWEAEASDPQWISVYLGGVYTIDSVVLNWEGAFAKTYKIQGSIEMNPTADSDWRDLYSESNGKPGVTEFKLNGEQVRHVRIYGTTRGTQWGYSLYEVEVYGTLVGEQDASAPTVDKTALTNKINEANTKVQASYTAESWAVLQSALSNADAVKNNANATQAEVNAAIITLNDAISRLVEAPKTDINIAKGKTATSLTGVAREAFDGNNGTRWESAHGIDPQWLAIDLGDTYELCKVVLNWEGAYGKVYKIQVSTVANPTESDWTDAYSEDNSDGGIDEITLNTVEARHVRMIGIERAMPYGYSLWEFEVYGTLADGTDNPAPSVDKIALAAKIGEANAKVEADYTTVSWAALVTALNNAVAVNAKATATQAEVDEAKTALTNAINSLVPAQVTPPPVEDVNVALGKNAATSSGNGAAAFDGNTGTRWESAFSDDQWISVYLGGIYSLSKVVLNWEGAFGKVYKIQVSSVENPTDSDWIDVYSENNSDGGIDEITLTGQQARHVRMLGITRALPYGYSLWEFQVFGSLVGELDPVAATSTLYLINGGEISLTPGGSEIADKLPEDTTHVEYLIENVNGAYNGTGTSAVELYVNGLAVGTGITGKVYYDFDGDGTWDRIENIDMMPTDGNTAAASYEKFTRNPSSPSGSGYEDFVNGKIKVDIYLQFGGGDGEIKVNAPTNSSSIVLPYGIQ
jgi:beta-glucanase (GH16 family)